LLGDQHGHDHAFERNRTGGIGAAGQLQPGSTEEFIQRVLIFFA
jgi:hypothetical protein